VPLGCVVRVESIGQVLTTSHWTSLAGGIRPRHPLCEVPMADACEMSRSRGATMWGQLAPLAGHPAPGPTCQSPHHNVGFPPPPRLHLRHPLSWFDPRAHVGRSGLYIPAPATLPEAILKP